MIPPLYLIKKSCPLCNFNFVLKIRKPIYKQVAAYGHFGRNDLDLPWERTDKADTLRKEALGE